MLLASTVAGCGGTEQPAAGSSATSSATQPAATPSAQTTRTTTAPSVVDLYVADHTTPCMVGPKPRACMQLRWNPDEPWEPSWNDVSSIAGFTYEPGFFYHLRVEKTPLPYPPPDAPQYTLRLVEVVDKRAAS